MQRRRLLPLDDDFDGPRGARLVSPCNRCHERKIRCGGQLPRCTACARTEYQHCNVEQCIMYPREYVQALEERVEWLEAAITELTEVGEVSRLKTGAELAVRRETNANEFAEEVGLLSLRGNGCYMGSMSGVTIAALFASAIRLYHDTPMVLPPETPLQITTSTHASFPPEALTAMYAKQYLLSVHRWYPVLDLTTLAESIHKLYHSRDSLDAFQRFVILMICAISSGGSSLDVFSSGEYYRAATLLLPVVMAESSLNSLRAIVLLCIWGLTSWHQQGAHSVDTWMVIGHGVRFAIAMGLSRSNRKWSMSRGEDETRRWIWWSLYSLERLIATGSGRVLVIRNEAIDADPPRDSLIRYPPAFCQAIGLDETGITSAAAIHLFQQRRLLGDIMECVYIARPHNRQSLSLEETTKRVFELQGRLIAWENDALNLDSIDSAQRLVMQLAFHHATLVLHRPSPSFPVPPPEVMEICLCATRAVIRSAETAVKDKIVEETIPGWTGLSLVFVSGLTLMYCSWASPTCPSAVRAGTEDDDLQSSLNVIKALAVSPVAQRYIEVYTAALNAFATLTAAQPTTLATSQEHVAQSVGLAGFDELLLDPEAIEYLSRILASIPDWENFGTM